MITRRSYSHRVYRPGSLRVADVDDRIVSVVFTTGADVPRRDIFGQTYIERLATGSENVNLDRLNAGAAMLDTHMAFDLGSIIGSVLPGSARMEGGKGLADIKLSSSARAADTVADIMDGNIRSVSIGYEIDVFERVEATNESPAIMIATSWTPLEISAVPIPADPGAQIIARTRSAAGLELHPCTITSAAKVPQMLNDAAETRRGYERFSRLRGKPVNPDVLARLAAEQAETAEVSHASPAAIAGQRAAAEAVFARAFPGRRRA